jgi:hypothetical protein
MRKSFFTVLMLISAVVSSKAQTIEPSVLASGGGIRSLFSTNEKPVFALAWGIQKRIT